jgi:uncharacterized protein (TIGR03382 family)
MMMIAPTRRRFPRLLVPVADRRLHFALALGCAVSACTDEPAVAEQAAASTVGDYTYSGCSTAVVIGLSQQIAEEANCEDPGAFVSFTSGNGITITSNAVLPYLDESARDDLQAAAAQESLQINSGLRTLAQQYLLYAWYEAGECGITAAATVGNSNHEGGRAVDLENWDERVSLMAHYGWSHDVAGDPVHFDHTASSDQRGLDVKAFQVLWNRNNPGDQIAEDGEYGPQTGARLKKSPATGFAMGPSCTTQTQQAAAGVVAVNGPDRAPPQTRLHYSITLANHGAVDWPATTQVQLASGTSSPLYDASWVSPTVVTTIGSDVPAGQQGTVELDVTTPVETATTPVSQQLALVDDSGASLGTFELAVTVVPGEAAPTSGDSGDQHDDGGVTTGGCDATGHAGFAPLLAALALISRARRRRAA